MNDRRTLLTQSGALLSVMLQHGSSSNGPDKQLQAPKKSANSDEKYYQTFDAACPLSLTSVLNGVYYYHSELYKSATQPPRACDSGSACDNRTHQLGVDCNSPIDPISLAYGGSRILNRATSITKTL
jgi:hypothetical protein